LCQWLSNATKPTNPITTNANATNANATNEHAQAN
jgi:hypothetical protein